MALSDKPLHFSLQCTSLYEVSITQVSWAADGRFGCVVGLAQPLLITTPAEELLAQCDSETVKAAATVRQSALSVAKQCETYGKQSITGLTCTHNLTCRRLELYDRGLVPQDGRMRFLFSCLMLEFRE